MNWHLYDYRQRLERARRIAAEVRARRPEMIVRRLLVPLV